MRREKTGEIEKMGREEKGEDRGHTTRERERVEGEKREKMRREERGEERATPQREGVWGGVVDRDVNCVYRETGPAVQTEGIGQNQGSSVEVCVCVCVCV